MALNIYLFPFLTRHQGELPPPPRGGVYNSNNNNSNNKEDTTDSSHSPNRQHDSKENDGGQVTGKVDSPLFTPIEAVEQSEQGSTTSSRSPSVSVSVSPSPVPSETSSTEGSARKKSIFPAPRAPR